MNRVLSLIAIYLTAAIVSCNGSSSKCLQEKCHMEMEIYFYPDGNGGVIPIPMDVKHCKCLRYADAGLK